ncbi:hypothetical protein FRX31_022712 [Thalictrum thalictroides]|uniref:Uncharacterized protein n=1 Tax=Thalictrum thalictroides TaxID=46969 RepID=A0A7J6VSF0_THATH|nr:hypothetical protein FRX31_022712 [Thalictrum thalictroides]
MPDYYKINVDISFSSAEKPIGIRYLIRTSNGTFVTAGCEFGNSYLAEEGEYNRQSEQGSTSN